MEQGRARAASVGESHLESAFFCVKCGHVRLTSMEDGSYQIRTWCKDSRDEPNSQYSVTASNQGSSKSQPSPPPVCEPGLRRVVGSDGSLLLRSSSGHERYEPFFSQWYSNTDSASLSDGLESDIGDPNADDEFPFSSKRPQREELLSLLPPMSSCDVLKDTYLKVFARLFHILHDPSFCSDYERFRADPEGVSLSWLALLFATLSVAVAALEEEDADLLHDLGRTTSVSKNVSILTSRYRAAAMQALEADNYLWRHNLYTLQALVIIIYGINHSHGSSWTLLGLARNIAFSLGCHVDPDNFGLSLVEAEERRRCWAAVSMLYTIQNSTMGNLDPTSLPTDVRLPLDVDDDKIMDDALMPMGSKTMPSQMSYLLHKFRLYDICSKICSRVLSKRSSTSYEIVHELDEAILGQHEAWNLQYLTHTQRSSLSDTHIVHLDILFGYSYQLMLLLHRPIILQYFGSSSARASYSRVQMQTSRLRCLESARSLLTIHRRAHESRPFQPYQWYNAGLGSFHAFHAAITIVYILGVSPDLDEVEAEQLRKEIGDSLDIFHILAACGKSRICQKALPILRRL
ncbi:transcriptional activator mut3p [Trichoderma arundinaceum]|uniref:Transcriptional activator mut3p n=1 Tax=Trichoderma arundinaceum TaxID=490622 RepID=A0A395NU99_TRIAR|nr:transcriptional activator mut3p [Trichoderma arundinaceum]